MEYEKISESEAIARYEQMLDECYQPFEMGELTFSPSKILKKLDEITYSCGFSEWLDSEGLEVED